REASEPVEATDDFKLLGSDAMINELLTTPVEYKGAPSAYPTFPNCTNNGLVKVLSSKLASLKWFFESTSALSEPQKTLALAIAAVSQGLMAKYLHFPEHPQSRQNRTALTDNEKVMVQNAMAIRDVAIDCLMLNVALFFFGDSTSDNLPKWLAGVKDAVMASVIGVSVHDVCAMCGVVLSKTLRSSLYDDLIKGESELAEKTPNEVKLRLAT
ncbi:hypothetical protein DIPPA_30032, partial [Diplonema papillatum]